MASHAFVPEPFPPLEIFSPEKTVRQGMVDHKGYSPAKAAGLFKKPWLPERAHRRYYIKRDLLKGRDWTPAELDQAAERGNFPQRPSDLFLRMYADVLTCLTRDPLAGNVSPALIGTSGTIPLTIVSTIPDIMKHYYDVIVLAEKEIFLVTNYWQPSDSVTAVGNALKELSKRVGERKGDKVVVKVMWDRGAFEQLINPHARVNEATWTGLKLPASKEVPNLSLEVINFHRPLLGTFHQKTMIVDRKVALLNSNNIQDRPNVEMMVHLEGPVVDSLYDTLLLSWSRSLNPPLPCLADPPAYPSPRTGEEHDYLFADRNPYLAEIDVTKAARAARKLLNRQNRETLAAGEEHHPSHWWSMASEAHRAPGSGISGGSGGGFANLVTQLMERAREEKRKALGEGNANANEPVTGVELQQVVANGAGGGEEGVAETKPVEKTEEGTSDSAMSGVPTVAAESEKKVDGEKSTPVVSPLLPDTTSAAGSEATEGVEELKPPSFPTATKTPSRLAALSTALNAGALAKLDAAFDDETLVHDFAPHFIHRTHKPFPMAVVNRRPHGMPGHQDIRVPQNAAWLAGLRYAEKNVFIQTPTLNAAPVVRGVLEACKFGGKDKKGIKVTLWLDLGFNDKGESVPFQGGTNEEVVFRLYKDLNRAGKQDNLEVYWYTGKDQIKPVNAVHKSRNCHVKFMSVDDHIGILGNGNQDTQSWFHSQESNIMVDDERTVTDWLSQLKTNQSTFQFGKVDTDGIWRDPQTKEPLQAPKSVSCFTAIWAMI
ncbi:hypothetical protein MNV49_006638 [Pseudohyphozyma bogoriensis]|nr:hypothetical protein MNV49_006638 [Pseudohyphozyma bogoriensis]